MTNEELILKFYDGDETILEKLYNKNIGFIRSIAKEVAVNFNCYNLNTTILYHEYHLFHHKQDLFSYKGNNIFIVRPLASYMAGRDVEFYSNDTCSLADSDICRIADTDV